MSDNQLAPFANQKYISLETYRKNGQAVRTPYGSPKAMASSMFTRWPMPARPSACATIRGPGLRRATCAGA